MRPRHTMESGLETTHRRQHTMGSRSRAREKNRGCAVWKQCREAKESSLLPARLSMRMSHRLLCKKKKKERPARSHSSLRALESHHRLTRARSPTHARRTFCIIIVPTPRREGLTSRRARLELKCIGGRLYLDFWVVFVYRFCLCLRSLFSLILSVEDWDRWSLMFSCLTYRGVIGWCWTGFVIRPVANRYRGFRKNVSEFK